MVMALMLLGIGLAFVGNIMILIAAFRESVIWGIACLVIPFAALAFIVMHWSETKNGFFLALAGGVLLIGGVVMSPDASVPEPETRLRAPLRRSAR